MDCSLIFACASLLCLLFWLFWRQRTMKVFGFFHPFCNDGGGGERVLWSGVRSVQLMKPNLKIVVYTGGGASSQKILSKVKSHFGIDLPGEVEFVWLRTVWLLEPHLYPVCTILLQSLASVVVGMEAVFRRKPDIFFDSMGFSFTYPFAWIFGGCTVGTYTHYPTISSDMLQRVQERRPTYNNDERISSSASLSRFKLCYYQLFAHLYGWMGSCSKVVLVNSSWTLGHIQNVWGRDDVTIVYPPCNTHHLLEFPLEERERVIVSIGQFREEKDHPLQLHSFHHLITNYPASKDAVLVLIGSCRNEGDQNRINNLKALQKKLNIPDDQVIYEINADYGQLLHWLRRASLGIHTMWMEHFGIGVVEYMAAGVIPVAHNSAGPKMDIVIEGTGFLASEPGEYAERLNQILSKQITTGEQLEMRAKGRKHSTQFSENEFVLNMQKGIAPLFR